jgi:hypothetical protein
MEHALPPSATDGESAPARTKASVVAVLAIAPKISLFQSTLGTKRLDPTNKLTIKQRGVSREKPMVERYLPPQTRQTMSHKVSQPSDDV